MSDLEKLYSAISLGQNINEITKLILDIYQNPQSIFEILRIISEQQDLYIRNQACVQLRIALSASWNIICQDPIIEQIKETILQVLPKEPNMLFRDSIIHAMEFIIEKKSRWPQIGQFVQNLLQTNDLIQIETALKVLYAWIPSFSDEEFMGLALTIGQNINMALSTNSIDIQIAGFNIFAQSIPFFKSPLEPPFSDFLVRIINVFQELMVQMNDNAFKVCQIIEHIIESNNGSIDPTQLLTVLLQMTQDERILPNYYFAMFSPLTNLAGNSDFPLAILKQFVDPIMKSTLLCISKTLSDECFSEDSLSMYIALMIDVLIESMNNEKLFSLALIYLPDNSINEAYAAAIVFDRFLEFSRSIAMKHSAEIVNRLLKYTNPNCHHALYEASLSVLSKLIDDTDNRMSDFFEPIVKCCLDAIDTGHDQLIINALKTLTVALYSLDYTSNYLEILVPKISALASADVSISLDAIPVLSAMINKCEKDIIPYIPLFLPLITQAAQISEKTQPALKGEALEALAQLISIAPEETANIIAPSMQLFMECTRIQDSTIVTKLLSSFSYLVSAKFEGIEAILPTIIQYSIAQLDCEQASGVITSDDFDPSENPDFNVEIHDSIIQALSVINSAAENVPQILAPFAQDVALKILNFTNYPSDLIVQNSVTYLATIIVTYNLDPNEYINVLVNQEEIFEHYSDIAVASMFNFCEAILEKNSPVRPEFMELIYLNSLKAIEHKLPSFDTYKGGDNYFQGDIEEEDDIDDDLNEQSKFDIVESVFRLLSVFVTKFTQFFNAQTLSKFVDILRRCQKKKFVLEIIYGTDILGQLFEANRSIFAGLNLKISLNIIKECLPLCDGSYRPCPIDAIRRIMLTDISVINDMIPQIIEKTNSVLGLENQGQPFYRETLSSAVSLLFALLKIQGATFPLDAYFPSMLASLPSRYNADYIYGTLVVLYLQAGELFNPFAPELIRVLAQTLSLKDNQLSKYDLTPDVYQSALKMLLILIQTVPNAQELLQQAVPDAILQDILQKRLSSASAT